MARHTFFCVDAHTCGNPVRVVAGGAPLLPNVPMIEKREIFIRDHDWVRRALMFEPRGHDVMSGSILYPSAREDCEVGVLFIEVTGCLPMCGHGTIGTVTVAIEEGLVNPREPGRLAIDAPAGRRRDRIRAERPFRRSGAPVQRTELFARRRCRSRRPRTGPAQDRCCLWRQLLRDHRAAEKLARPRRHAGERNPKAEPDRARRGARRNSRPCIRKMPASAAFTT